MSNYKLKTRVFTFIFVTMIGSFFALLAMQSSQVVQAGVVKTVMCHKPGTEDQATIEVAENAVHAHEKHGDIVGTACENIRQTSELCSILDELQVTPSNVISTYRVDFPDTELFPDETVWVAVTNHDFYNYSYRVSISNEVFSSPFTVFKEGSTVILFHGQQYMFPLNNVADPSAETNFMIRLDAFPAEPGASDSIQNVTFEFSCS